MKSLLLFHIRVGVRVAVRSFMPLFAAIIFGIMFTPDPAGTVTMLALRAFAPHPSVGGLLPAAILSFVLPMWAASRLSPGLNGWMRHLSFGSEANKRGLILALGMAQIPLWIALVLLGFISHLHGHGIWPAVPHLCLLLAAGAYAALPVCRRPIVLLFALLAAACAFSRQWIMIAAGILLLIASDLISGPIQEKSQRKPWRSAESFFEFKVARRALGSKILVQYLAPLLILAVTALFARNSELSGSLLLATGRFGGCASIAVFLSSAAAKLAECRPPWPWARSFPISSYKRVATDSLFLGVHALPLLIPVALIDNSAIGSVLFTLPLLAFLAAGHMRRSRERRIGADSVLHGIGILVEDFAIAAILALLPWTVIFWILAAVPAFIAARNADIRQKVSLWLELHYIGAGDPLNWSDR